jgi:preprotein translocase subunit SecF
VTYSNAIAVNRQQFARRNQNIVSMRERAKVMGPISTTIIIIALSCVLFLLYLTQVTKTNTFSYELNELTQKQTALREEHDQLEVESARLQALERTKTSQVAQNMTPVSAASYIQN